MIPDLERLIQLQQLDTAIADARRLIAAHPERLQAADVQLGEAQAVLDTAKQKLKDSQEARRALERDAAVYQGRLSKFKDQLSAVKTNREYQAMQKEMEAAQAELQGVEDRELEVMVAADAIAAEVKAAEAAMATQQKLIDAEKRDLAQQLTRSEEMLKTATDQRHSLVGRMEARLVTLFEQLAKQRKGVGVSAAANGLCTFCHVRLRPHVYQQVRANNSIVQCDSCQRILYYIPPPASVDPPVIIAS